MLEDLPPHTQNLMLGSFRRPGKIVLVMESPIGPQVQMLQEGVHYLQTACEMFAGSTRQEGESTGDLHPLERIIMRLERTLGEIAEEFGRG